MKIKRGRRLETIWAEQKQVPAVQSHPTTIRFNAFSTARKERGEKEERNRERERTE